MGHFVRTTQNGLGYLGSAKALEDFRESERTEFELDAKPTNRMSTLHQRTSSLKQPEGIPLLSLDLKASSSALNRFSVCHPTPTLTPFTYSPAVVCS